jgi:cytochrome c-type biogenesis protein CcmH/NrfG
MLLFGSVAAALVAAGAIAAWWWLQRRRLTLANSIGLVALGLWAAAVAIKLYVDRAEDEAAAIARTSASIAWPLVEPLPALSPTSLREASAPIQAAPVESLIGGLEARLAAEPEDSAGWALLAQSYAFVSNRDGAETALRRAVELGADEAALRERVRSAQRTAAPVDWVEETLRAARERRRLAAGEAR